MSYDHATELANSQPVEDKLSFLVKELGRWAAKNPSLRPLYEEFVFVAVEVKEKIKG